MIDSHCHIAGPEFANDLQEVVDRARAAGVVGALCILSEGTADEDTAAAQLRSIWPQVRFATGIHPHNAATHASSVTAAVAAVEQRLEGHAALAVGEIGLDYHYDPAPRPDQQAVFRRHL